jgi:hypothetical protein
LYCRAASKRISKRQSSRATKVPDETRIGKGMTTTRHRRWSVALAVMLAIATAQPAFAAYALTFPPTTFTILNPDTGAAIGRAIYRVDSIGDKATLHGEDGYFDGQTDVEIAHVDLGVPGRPPRLVDFDHTFYNADRSILRRHHLDVKSGAASCIDNSGGQKSEQDDLLDVPDNTWGGASIMIPIQEFLRSGDRATSLPLNVFSCAAGPRIIPINVVKDPGNAIWTRTGHEALRVEVQPNFGWLNVIIEAFMPKLHAWFDPNDNWALVGDEAARYYKGPPIMLVKAGAAQQAVTR